MNQRAKRKILDNIIVISFPRDEQRLTKAIKYLTELKKIVLVNYNIKLQLKIVNGNLGHRAYSQFISDILSNCEYNKYDLDCCWLYYINSVIKFPTNSTINSIRNLLNKRDDKFLKPYLDKAKKNSKKLFSSVGVNFFLICNIKLREDQGPWGVCMGTYPFGVAIETTGLRESIFHEFLHLFGLDDGYDNLTKKSLLNCKNCWMQWEAIRGSGLCKNHVFELSQFINKIKKIS